MPWLTPKGGGDPQFISPAGLSSALASGLYEAPAEDTTVSVVNPSTGLAGDVSIRDLAEVQERTGAAVEGVEARRERDRAARVEADHGGTLAQIGTVVEQGLDTATGGLYGTIAEASAGKGYTRERRERLEANPGAGAIGTAAGLAPSLLSGGAGAAGSVARATPIGIASRAGTKLATKLGGGVRGALAGGVAEGALLGVGSAGQEIGLEDDVSVERALGALSSGALYGGAIGGAVGVGAKVAEKGLLKAKAAADDLAARVQKGGGISDDIAKMDAKGLRAAEEAEHAAIEASRVPQRAQMADEIVALQKESKASKFWLATEDKSLRKAALKADKWMTGLTDDIKGLGQKPQSALKALRIKEQALDQIVKGGDEVRAAIKAEQEAGLAAGKTATAGENRLKALAGAEDMLAKNRSLQEKIMALDAPPSSPRLKEIADAKDILQSAGGKKKGLVDQMVQGSAYGAVLGAIPAMPFGGVVAPLIAAKASNAITGLLTGKLGAAAAEQAQRTAQAVKAFVDVGTRVTKSAPPLATKVLTSVSYADQPKKRGEKVEAPTTLVDAYKAREQELRSQMTTGPTGAPVMRPEKRRALGDRLAGVRASDPVLADRMETVAARRLEFLASKLPKRPDYLATQMGGPDRWKPSDMDMRAFARYAAAVEDPGGVEERLVSGQVTPEDAEAYKTVYPERFEALKRQIVESLPELRGSLPYERQVALSIFTGIPVDPAMRPQTLARLQANFAMEEGSEGGSMAPRATPNFGSVKSAEKATPSQQRQAGE